MRSLQSRGNADRPDREWPAPGAVAAADCAATLAGVVLGSVAAAIVIGDSYTRNQAMYALDDLRDALTDELYLEAWASQQRPMLGGREQRTFFTLMPEYWAASRLPPMA